MRESNGHTPRATLSVDDNLDWLGQKASRDPETVQKVLSAVSLLRRVIWALGKPRVLPDMTKSQGNSRHPDVRSTP